MVDFKSKMIKLQHILSNMFESKRQNLKTKILEANMTPTDEAKMVEKQINNQLVKPHTNVIRFHDEASPSKGIKEGEAKRF